MRLQFARSPRTAHPFSRSILLLLVLATVMLPPARAEGVADGDNYLTINGFYLFADEDRQVDDGMGVEAGYGWRWRGPLWLEVRGTAATLDRGDTMGSDFYQYGIGADLQYAFGNRDQLTPYLLAGGGASYNDMVPSSLDGWDYFVNAGVGLTRNLFGFDNLRWRVEGRAIYDNFLDGLVDYRVSAGLEFVLRKQRPAPEPEVREVVREVVVIKEVPVAAPADNPDSDGDGVVNASDKCPDTPRGAKVDGRGCVIEQTLTLHDVTFETNSSRLTMNGRRLLDGVVAFLRADPFVSAVVEGHTDNRGGDAYNLRLSQARAESVRAYLVQEGIGAARLEARGYGEGRPMASNDTEAGREANRRVEFVLRKSQ